MDRIAFLIHGFGGKTSFMKEINETLNNLKIYNEIHNLSLYDSLHGLDFSKKYDLSTPIYDHKTEFSLAHKAYYLIKKELNEYSKSVKIDVFAHSMGGLVIRSVLTFILNKKPMINNHKFSSIYLLGTPNHGTRLAKKVFTVSGDLIVNLLNLALEIPLGRIDREDFNILDSQLIQMTPKSKFLVTLNENYQEISQMKTITIRGLQSYDQLGAIWQPFLFSKVWFNKKFPYIHVGKIPNDGVVDSASVPLKGAINLIVKEATHMGLLYWKSNDAGKKVFKKIKPLILQE